MVANPEEEPDEKRFFIESTKDNKFRDAFLKSSLNWIVLLNNPNDERRD